MIVGKGGAREITLMIRMAALEPLVYPPLLFQARAHACSAASSACRPRPLAHFYMVLPQMYTAMYR